MKKNFDLLLSMLLATLNKAGEMTALFVKARAEGRDVSDAELDVLSSGADASSVALKAEIKRQREA